MTRLEEITAIVGLWCIAAETNGYLLVRNGQSLLIDCPVDDICTLLDSAGLPIPSVILHTQVQEEHCREWATLSQADVFVFAESEEVARRSAQYFADCATVWPPSREWENRGEERYGIGGCVTERPPTTALNVAGVLRAGETFHWQDIELDVMALPGSGKRAIGLYWRQHDILFSGDLIHAGGCLVNFYDLERSYGLPNGYAQLRESLAAVSALHPALLLPSTGPIISDPATDIARLSTQLDAFLQPPVFRTDDPVAQVNYPPLREFGRYREVTPGVFQNTNFGNIILFVDAQGRGLMIDPDPCVWLTWEENCREMHSDLDLLERETGVQRIEMALITHPHGDHLQYCDLLRERYGTQIVATPDVGTLMARASSFPYPCLIDWYGFPFDHVHIDRCVPYDEQFFWNEIAITPFPTPGHCFAHAGFFLNWQGINTVCVGDTIQYGAGPVGIPLPILYNDSAWPDHGTLVAVKNVLAMHPELVLCGHSQSFFDHDGVILREMQRAGEIRERLAAELVHDGDLLRAMTPPGYDAIRPSRTMCPIS